MTRLSTNSGLKVQKGNNFFIEIMGKFNNVGVVVIKIF